MTMPYLLNFGDCIEGMAHIDSASADCCITDPPYGDTSLPWDRRVGGWIDAVSRILKPDSSIWVFGSMRFLAPLFNDMAEAGFKYSQDIVWEKQNGTGFHADRFRRVHEHAVMFYRGAWSDVHHETQFSNDAQKNTVRRKQRAKHWGEIDQGHYVSEDGGPRMLRSVFQVNNEHGQAVHPTQKPVELLRPLVRYSCPPGGIVLDPFAGSAAIGLACLAEKRSYIGFESDAEHYGNALARLREAVDPAQPDFFGA